MARSKNTRARRGVLLLIILGMLAMFGLIGLTFVLTSNQQRRGAETATKIEQYADPPERLLKDAFAQVARGSKNVASVMGPFSLLESMYGDGAVTATITAADIKSAKSVTTIANGQLIQIPAPSNFNHAQNAQRVGAVLTFATGPLAGKSTRIMRYLPAGIIHPSKGLPAKNSFHIVATEGITYATLTASASAVGYVVNSLPFSGTWFGYNKDATPTQPLLNYNLIEPTNPLIPPEMGGSLEVALLPNLLNKGRNPTRAIDAIKFPSGENPDYPGLANPDYTAVDYQHPLLAMVLPVPIGAAPPLPPPSLRGTPRAQVGNGGVMVPIPSMQRSELFRYWINRFKSAQVTNLYKTRKKSYAWIDDIYNFEPTTLAGSSYISAKMLYCISLRPIGKLPGLTTANQPFNPKFDGSNPRYNPFWDGRWVDNCDVNLTKYTKVSDRRDEICDWQWDVDNDGDGIPDSIWVDLGFPVRKAADGRLYKPLFAILCVDMDGRLNLNAHGCIAQTNNSYYAPVGTSRGQFTETTADTAKKLKTLASSQGRGSGPAEINPQWLLNSDPTYACFNRILYGSGAQGRYGEITGSTSSVPGRHSLVTPLFRNRYFDYVGNYWNYFTAGVITQTDAYGTPPELFGTGAIGLDPAGQPIYCGLGNATPLNTPYEINLSARRALYVSATYPAQAIDNPFTPAELERVLRPFDAHPDNISSRLLDLTTEARSASFDALPTQPTRRIFNWRNELTTESWDPPCPPLAVPYDRDLAHPNEGWTSQRMPTQKEPGLLHPVDLLRQRLSTPTYTPSYQQITELLPDELLAGLRMDLNRPFGKARPNASNYIDYPMDAVITDVFPRDTRANTNWQYNDNGKVVSTVPRFDLNNGALDPDTATARLNPNVVITGLHARQLYARHLYVLACLLTDTQALLRIANPTGAVSIPPSAQQIDNAARMLAQWAVNVVDFRDRDSIMTPFEYDPNLLKALLPPAVRGPSSPTPYAGWPVNTSSAMKNDPLQKQRYLTNASRIVWGCERPELLMTETFACHDRRTQDTNVEGDPLDKPPGYEKRNKKGLAGAADPKNLAADPHFDSRYRPEGSLFIELYNPWTSQEAPSRDLQDLDSTGTTKEYGINLSKTAGTSGDPVWRILITLPDPDPKNLPDSPPPANKHNPNYKMPDPDEPPALNPTGTQFATLVDRSVYFVRPLAGKTYGNFPNEKLRFFPSAITHFAKVRPGRYAVVGPGNSLTAATTTYLGFNDTEAPDKLAGAGARRIELFPDTYSDLDPKRPANQVAVYPDGTTNMLAPAAPPVAIVIDQASKANGSASVTGVPRLSLTEPPDGYPKPNKAVAGALSQYNPVRDIPVDYEFDKTPKKDVWSIVMNNGTHIRYRVLYLQRLADPTQAWDVNLNPYRTIDVMQVDLTTFNGAWNKPCVSSLSQFREGQPLVGAQVPRFFARERGQLNAAAGTNELWALERETALTAPNSLKPVKAPKNCFFQTNFACSLGCLNTYFGPAGTLTNQYKGAPQTPFPWLGWNNRPFISHLELLLVPGARSSQLLSSYSLVPTTTTQNPYKVPTPQDTTSPFPNLPNWFQHLPEWFFSGPSTTHTAGLQLHRILEYVTVPSRFVGTEILANATSQAAINDKPADAGHPNAKDDATVYGMHNLHPPFNRISCYRDPGRMNLNTIFSHYAWKGLMNCFPDPAGDWGGDPTIDTIYSKPPDLEWFNFLRSRRGIAAATFKDPDGAAVDGSKANSTTGNDALRMLLMINPLYPTRFENPYRSFSGADLVPVTPMQTNIGNATAPATNAGEINATLLRQDTTTTAGLTRPLYAMDATSYPKSVADAKHPMNPNRSPYFRYQGLQRLGNLVTTRSNVYAVWVTVGYFEATPYTGNFPQFHPDGYELGQELNSDTGEIKRHRSFFIYDRTIPMGFIRGQDLNYEDGILLERFIE